MRKYVGRFQKSKCETWTMKCLNQGLFQWGNRCIKGGPLVSVMPPIFSVRFAVDFSSHRVDVAADNFDDLGIVLGDRIGVVGGDLAFPPHLLLFLFTQSPPAAGRLTAKGPIEKVDHPAARMLLRM